MVQHKIIGKANGIGSNKVINLQGYVKPSTSSPITAADNLNTALGKLEKGMDLRLSLNGGWVVTGNATFTGGVYVKSNLEIFHATPYIDFHFGHSSSDYTSRIVENVSGQLQMIANVNITKDLTVSGSITAAGNITAFSDIKLKENITPIENALDKVKQLKGIIYNLKGDENNKQAGLIAQDVQKVLPEVVLENDNGLLSIDYSRIVSLLVNAVIELDKKVGGK